MQIKTTMQYHNSHALELLSERKEITVVGQDMEMEKREP